MQHGPVVLTVQECRLRWKAQALRRAIEAASRPAMVYIYIYMYVYICMKCICAAARNAGLPSAACKPELGKAPGCSRDAVVLKDGGRNVPARACGSHESENEEFQSAQEHREREDVPGLCSLQQRQPCMKLHLSSCDIVLLRMERYLNVSACCHMQGCRICNSYA